MLLNSYSIQSPESAPRLWLMQSNNVMLYLIKIHQKLADFLLKFKWEILLPCFHLCLEVCCSDARRRKPQVTQSASGMQSIISRHVAAWRQGEQEEPLPSPNNTAGEAASVLRLQCIYLQPHHSKQLETPVTRLINFNYLCYQGQIRQLTSSYSKLGVGGFNAADALSLSLL